MSFGRVWNRTIPLYQLVYLMIHNIASRATAGVCWLNMDNSSGRCMTAFSLNISRADCCGTTSGHSVSWSPHSSPSRSMVFYWNYLAEGATSCQRCHNSCETVKCGPGKICKMRHGHPECLCRPECKKSLQLLGPVCGTDGRRYRNHCALLRSNCHTEGQVRVAYLGRCRRSCKHVECYHGNHCLQDQNGLPHCVQCATRCQLDIDNHPGNYVCGADGHTYKNTCELKAAICRKGRSIRIAYKGACVRNQTCAGITCPPDMTCLADPHTDQPNCMNCRHVCTTSIHIPICGTDGRTYASYCQMQQTACAQRVVITTRRNGACPVKRKPPNIKRKSSKKRRKRRKKRTKNATKTKNAQANRKNKHRRAKRLQSKDKKHTSQSRRSKIGRKRRKNVSAHSEYSSNKASSKETLQRLPGRRTSAHGYAHDDKRNSTVT